MSGPNFMAINLILVKIFRSEPKKAFNLMVKLEEKSWHTKAGRIEQVFL